MSGSQSLVDDVKAMLCRVTDTEGGLFVLEDLWHSC